MGIVVFWPTAGHWVSDLHHGCEELAAGDITRVSLRDVVALGPYGLRSDSYLVRG